MEGGREEEFVKSLNKGGVSDVMITDLGPEEVKDGSTNILIRPIRV